MKKAKLIQYALSIIAFLFLSLTGIAQTRKITGTVLEGKNNTPLEGATVSAKNAKQSTVTTADGRFEITVPEGKAVLTISYVGYNAQTITAGAKETAVSVTLNIATDNQLSDVVVVGYGTVKRKDLTGAISSIKSDHLNLGGTTTNIGQAIQGRAAGVVVQQTSFAPGAGSASLYVGVILSVVTMPHCT